METQNTELTLTSLEMRAERALQVGSALLERMNRETTGRMATDTARRTHKIPLLIRGDHNAGHDGPFLLRMHHEKRKRRVPPRSTREEGVYGPALTNRFQKLGQQPGEHRVFLQTLPRISVAWVAAILGVVGVLTAIFTIAIAISV